MQLPPIRLLLTGIITALGGSFHFGYTVTVINPTFNIFKQLMNESLSNHYAYHMNDVGFRFLWATVSGCVFVGSMLGSAVMAPLSRRVSRRQGLMVSCVTLLVSAPLMPLASLFNCFELFFISRLLTGTGAGLAIGFQTLYLAEISPLEHRGFMNVLTGFSVEIGSNCGNWFGLQGLLGTVRLWPLLFTCVLAPTFVLLVVLLRGSRESPSYLMSIGREEAARESIVYYQGVDVDLDAAVRTIKAELLLEKDEVGIKQVWRSRPLRNATILAVLLNGAVGFSGVAALSYFGTLLLEQLGLDQNMASLANAIAGLFSLAASAVAAVVVDRVGRRTLVQFSLLTMIAINLLMMLLGLLNCNGTQLWHGGAFLFLLAAFMYVFGAGVGPISWFIANELTPPRARSSASSVANGTQYLTGFLVPIAFLPLEGAIGPFSFLLFVVPLAAMCLCLHAYLPETRLRPIADIMDDLNNGRLGRGNRVKMRIM